MKASNRARLLGMQILLRKGHDDQHALTCRRSDGTSTWAKIKGPFGPMHDLAHYVVETTLGISGGFYGLLLNGHDISSFEEDEDLSWIGEEGIYVELVVMSLQYVFNGVVEEKDFDQAVRDAMLERGVQSKVSLTPGRINTMGSRYHEVIAQWTQLAPGDTLALVFPDEALLVE